ncbi:hypothetical protein [Allokutzneria albata]|uniref:Uncharacterized protein n=1 Tax=Allokutzneria albata TaxID=211114 RepID=A0A1G9VA02_ALLAB|nr:hypothetical protein [Allokutzneria albata]SDM68705.1 hypothetical protein SAMN04489726_2909 [Allokutzneria albata]
MPAVSRVLGAATTVYSAAIVLWPALLAKPCGMVRADGRVAPEIRSLISAIGVRDAAIGAAMMTAPEGRALRAVLVARVAADAADACIFGRRLPDRRARVKVAGFAATWATLCAVSAFAR